MRLFKRKEITEESIIIGIRQMGGNGLSSELGLAIASAGTSMGYGRVEYISLNDREDLNSVGRLMHAEVLNSNGDFKIGRISFRHNLKGEDLADIIRQDNSLIVMDFGNLNSDYQVFYNLCKLRIMVLNLTPFTTERIMQTINDREPEMDISLYLGAKPYARRLRRTTGLRLTKGISINDPLKVTMKERAYLYDLIKGKIYHGNNNLFSGS